MRRPLVLALLLGSTSAAAMSCTDDSSTPDAAGTLDASYVDVTTGTPDARIPDSSRADAPDSAADASSADAHADVVVADANAEDASDATVTFDAGADSSDGSADADQDANVEDADAQVDADAALGFDDAGCPLSSGAALDAADAGIPATGLALWMRADRGIATLDGGAVCRWDDMSGNGRSFVPATATPPTLSPSGLKAQPAVSFGVSGQHLVRGDVLGISGSSGRTIILFGATQDTTTRFQYFFQGKGGTAGTYFGTDQNTFLTAGAREGVYVTNNAYDALATPTTTNPRLHFLSISSLTPGTVLATALVYAVDGTVVTLTHTGGGLGNGTAEDFSAADTTVLGGASAGFTGALLGEILVYDHALTAPDRAAVEQYLQARFP